MPSFEIIRPSSNRACVVRLFGDLDTAVVPELREQLGAALDSGCGNVVLDFSQVKYADSSALGLLVWLDHRLGSGGGRLVLAGSNPDVQRILEISGLVSIAASIAMSSDVGSALAGLEMPDKPLKALWSQGLEMLPDVDNLGAVRERVCELIVPLGFPEAAIFDLKVALGEALANAIRHGSSGVDDAPIRIGVLAYEDRVVIEVCDSGCGFNGMPSPSDDLYAPGGRGIMFMRALMDRVEFDTPESGGTCVRLVKHRALV